MPFFTAPDGTRLAYDVKGGPLDSHSRKPLICIPGGPMREPVYLGDLGGLADARPLVILNLRGTGGSDKPADPQTYRADRMIEDVDALREHLGREQLDLLAHSAGGTLALLYAAAHPERVSSLILVTTALRALGMPPTPEHRAEAKDLRKDEPWYADACAAEQRIDEDEDNASTEDWLLYAHFTYGRWDTAIEAFEAASDAQFTNEEASALFLSPEACDPEQVKADLANLTAPVLILAAEYDALPRPEVATLGARHFPNARVVVQPHAGHFPWIDDPATFVRLVTGP
ncbi:alpha/beta hydrolase [Actinospica durhamensis]|uniref:Alpha/beta hydrolase n=1 Tax=Actinospica durhamensis TaxID=1508375 RepID=A0A941EXD7_9ACTN|nr:alpha/beta hydrolase [Actinospica durhamensis]MBR7839605.1 alpha/beta hydrolase [Actinospica durhamensis]